MIADEQWFLKDKTILRQIIITYLPRLGISENESEGQIQLKRASLFVKDAFYNLLQIRQIGDSYIVNVRQLLMNGVVRILFQC